MNSKILLLSSMRLPLLLLIGSFFMPAPGFSQGHHRKQDNESASVSGPSNRNKPYRTYEDKEPRKENNRKYDNRDDDRSAADRGGNEQGRGHEGNRRDRHHHDRRDGAYRRPDYVHHQRAPHWHYANMPRHGAVVDYYPSRAQIIKYGATPYYFYEGVFYRAHNRKYVVARAPLGLRVRAIPVGCRTFVSQGRPYFYYYGTYYVQRGNSYETVSAPVGSLVDSIPDGYEKLIVDGETYYIVDGVQYKAVLYDGEIWYEVIKVDC